MENKLAEDLEGDSEGCHGEEEERSRGKKAGGRESTFEGRGGRAHAFELIVSSRFAELPSSTFPLRFDGASVQCQDHYMFMTEMSLALPKDGREGERWEPRVEKTSRN